MIVNPSKSGFDNVPVQLWIAGADGNLKFVNTRLLEYSGLAPERLLEESWQVMVHPADLPSALDRWSHALSTGADFEAEGRLLNPTDRRYYWHLLCANAVREEGGAIGHWVGIHINIDSYRRAEEASSASVEHMRRERERIRGLFSQSPAAISVSLGADHRIDLTNAMFRQLIGGRNIEGQTVREAFPELESQGFFDLLNQVYRSGQPHEGKEVHVRFHRDGSGKLGEGYFNFRYQPLFDDSGEVYGIMTLSVEVTDQVLARRQIERLAAERAAVLSQLSEGVIITDVAGRITFVNEAANRFHGIARLDVPPEQYSETYHLLTVEGDPYPFDQLPLTRAVLHDEVIKDSRWRIKRPDGSVLLAEGNARPVIGPGGEKIGAVLTFREIDE